MGWQVGYDDNWDRWVGYGVPSICDHPGCGAKIDRGLARVCGSDVFGGDDGCGLYFCGDHLTYVDVDAEWIDAGTRVISACERCAAWHEAGDDEADLIPFEPTPDTAEWVEWILTDESWAEWREDNPAEVEAMRNTEGASQ